MSKYDEYYKDKNNVGTVWKNTNKTNDKQPEFSGVAKVNGVLHRMLMDNHGEKMLNHKSKELINKLDLI